MRRLLMPFFVMMACSPPMGPVDSGNPDKPAPTVTSVTPTHGPHTGGTSVTINGSNFQQGASVVFGTTSAANVSFTSSTQLIAVTAAAPSPGSASVTVINPDSKQASLADAFVFDGDGMIQESLITNPATAIDNTGASPLNVTVTAQVKIPGVTELMGQGMNVRCQVGYALDNEVPDNWVDAAYSKDADLFDEYAGAVTLPTPMGMEVTTYVLGARFSIDDGATWQMTDRDGSANGFSEAELPRITVSQPVVDWCKLGGVVTSPPDVFNLAVGDPGPTIYAQVYKKNVTEAAGAGAGIVGELGYGPDSTASSTWTWMAGTYNVDQGNNDEWMATLPTSAMPGTYKVTFRFKLGSGPYWYCDADGTDNGTTHAEMDVLNLKAASPISSCQLLSVDNFQIGSGDPLHVTAAVRIPGASADAGATVGLRGQVGVGTQGDNASTSSTWGWGEAAYLQDDDAGRDVFAVTTHPAYSGTRAVSFRFSLDDGSSWSYCDLNGSDVNGYEVSEQYNVNVGSTSNIDFCNLQFPPTMNVPADAGGDVYGQIYLAGVSAHPYPGVLAQAGWGVKVEDPGVASSWVWLDAGFNGQMGNNDEYVAHIKPPAGTWNYVFRYTQNNGATWCYGDLDGNGTTMGFNGENGANENLGVATVTP
jgi:hypothetical protein